MPKFIPITVQLLLGDAKAQIAQLRTELGGVEKSAGGISSQIDRQASAIKDKLSSAFSSLKESISGGSSGLFKNILPDADKLTAGLGGVSGGFGQVAAGAGLAAGAVAGAAVAIGAATLALSNEAAQLKLTADVTGLNIQQLQLYENAAKVTGTALNTLTDGVSEFRNKAKEAATSNLELSRAFEKLGIDAKTAATNPQQAFESFLDQLQQMPNDLSRVNAAQKIFGDGNQALIRTVVALTQNQGELRNQLQEVGVTFDQQATNDLAKINREYELLKLKGETLAKSTFVSLITSVRTATLAVGDNKDRAEFLNIVFDKLGFIQLKTAGEIDNATGSIRNQTDALASLNAQLLASNKEVSTGIQTIALKARNAQEAVTAFRERLALDDDFNAAVSKLKTFQAAQRAIQETLNPKPAVRGGGGFRPSAAKEKSEFEQLTDSLKKLNEQIAVFQLGTTKEFRFDIQTKEPKEIQAILSEISKSEKLLGLKIVLDDKEGLPVQTAKQLKAATDSIKQSRDQFKLQLEIENQREFKKELEEIIKLRRDLGLALAAPLPEGKGVKDEIGRLKALKDAEAALKSVDVFGVLAESSRRSNEALSNQLQTLDRLITDALPKTEAATVSQSLAQNELYQSLLQTNPALAEYYQRQAQAADATIANTRAAEAFASVRDQLNGQLSQFQNLTVEQTTALKLQGAEFKNLTDAQRNELLTLAQQVDGQKLFQDQLAASQQATEQFANQLRGIFDRLLDGPEAFFDNLKQTLKRTLSQMLSDLLTSQALKILGIVPGGGGGSQPAFAGLGQIGGGGSGGSGGGGIGGAISRAFTGGGGGSAPFLTGGFGGGDPAGQILNRVPGGGFANQIIGQVPGGGLRGLLGKLPLLGKFFAPKAAAAAIGAGGTGAFAGATAGATAGAAGGGGFLSSIFGGGGAALFSNPVTAIIGGALIALPFLTGLFGDRTFNRFRNEVKKAYQIEVDKKQEGRSLFQESEQIGKNVFGKNYKRRIPELIQLRPVKELIANYGIATGQDKSPLVRQFKQRQEVADPESFQNQFVRRQFGGPIIPGRATIVGERRPEVAVFGGQGEIFPSIAAFERELIAALQKRALGGIFGGASSSLLSQAQARLASQPNNRDSELLNAVAGVLADVADVLGNMKAVSPGYLFSQGAREAPNVVTKALATDFRSDSAESREVLRRARGFK